MSRRLGLLLLLSGAGAAPLGAQVDRSGGCSAEGVVVAGVLTDGTVYDHRREIGRGGFRDVSYSLECIAGTLILRINEGVQYTSPVLVVVDTHELSPTFEVTFSETLGRANSTIFAVRRVAGEVSAGTYSVSGPGLLIRSGPVAFVGTPYRDIVPTSGGGRAQPRRPNGAL
jgi:hypothetical protein